MKLLTITANKATITITAGDKTTTAVYDIVINAIMLQPTIVIYSGALFLGQAIKEPGIWQKPDNTPNANAVLITISNVANGVITWKLESNTSAGLKSQTGTKTAVANKFELTTTDLPLGENDLVPFLTDGNTISITLTVGMATSTTQTITYKPKEIRTWHDLQAMRHDLAGDYVLMNDIVFPNPGTNDLPTTGFQPIGRDEVFQEREIDSDEDPKFDGNPFPGSFDGKGLTISNLFIVGDEIRDVQGSWRPAYVGMFGKIDAPGKIFQNVIIDHSGIEGFSHIGAFSGYFKAGIMRNVGIISKANKKIFLYGLIRIVVVGLVGKNTGTIKNCYSKSDVFAEDLEATGVGGLVGLNRGGIVSGYANGNVKDYGERTSKVGGLVGANTESGTVYGYATGNVTGSKNVGGLVGYCSDGNIVGYSTSNVYFDIDICENIGGLVGYASSIPSTINIVGYATGRIAPIEGSPYIKGENIGGLVGQLKVGNTKSKLIGYYAGNFLAGSNMVGGLVGSYRGSGQLTGHILSFNMYRTEGTGNNFGFCLGYKDGNANTYYYTDITTNLGILTNPPTTVYNGVRITEITAKSQYVGYSFVDDATPGPWVWRNGKTPALQLRYSDGTDIIAADAQP